jgi:hypothetical protein
VDAPVVAGVRQASAEADAISGPEKNINKNNDLNNSGEIMAGLAAICVVL